MSFEITINGQTVSIPSVMTIQQVLETVDVPPNYLAVEINSQVVPREQHGSHLVHAGDEVELVTLVGGG